MANLEDLVLRIRADSKQLQAALRDVREKNRRTSLGVGKQWASTGQGLVALAAKLSRFAGIGGVIGAGLGLAELARQSEHFQDVADSVDKAASKLGVGRQALQEWRFAAGLAGVETNTFDQALQRFIRRAGEAASGTGEARGALRELGVQLVDSTGKLRSSEAIFEDAIRALGRIEDATIRTATAQKLFDSEGVALVNLATNFDELRDRARDLGVALDDDVIDALVTMKDRAAELEAQLEQRLSRSMTRMGILSLALKERLVGAVVGISEAIDESETLRRAFDNITPPELLDDLEVVERRIGETELRLSTLNEEMARFVRLNSGLPEQALADQVGGFQSRIGRASDELARLRDRLEEIQNPKTETIAAPIEVKSLRPEDEAAKARARELARAQRELNAILDAGRTPAERLSLAMEKLTRDYEAGLISGEELAQAQASIARQFERLAERSHKSAEGFAKDIENLGGSLVDGFSDSMATMLLEGKGTFQQLGQSFAHDFVSTAVRALSVRAFVGLFGGVAGALAEGGPVAAGRPYLVGERGPEIVVPKMSGYVLPNQALRSIAASRQTPLALSPPAPTPVRVTVINQTRAESTVQERQGPGGIREIEVLIADTVAADVTRGGTVARAIGNRFGARPRGV